MVMQSSASLAGLLSVQSVSVSCAIEELVSGVGNGTEPCGPRFRNMHDMLLVAASLSNIGSRARATALATRPLPGSHQYSA